MVERPLILFAEPELAEKEKRFGGSGRFFKPSHKRQIDRISPKFDSLQRILDQGRVQITDSANGIDPEYTLVFETVGDPQNFYKAVNNLKKDYPNIEWLIELSGSCPNTEDFYMLDSRGCRDDGKNLTTKIFCIMTNQKALSQIVSLWNCFKADANYKFKRGLSGFKNLFITLRDVHLWGIHERIEDTGVLEDWKNELLDSNRSSVNAQIELFCRKSSEKQKASEEKIEQLIKECNGTVICKSLIPEIAYHALLVEIPRDYAEKIINQDETKLIIADEIMFIKASGQSVSIGYSLPSNEVLSIVQPTTIINEPILALFDGMPQENHPLLSDLLIVDDPDGIGNNYPVDERIHGTSMASLILRGQVIGNISQEVRKIYVRPIMKSRKDLDGNVDEYIPNNFLLVDKIHECIRRLFEPVAGRVAPSVRIINLSIGILYREYYSLISPLARLLDWLSYKYRVLFVVSAGNHKDDIDLGMKYSDFLNLNIIEKSKVAAKYINNYLRNLRLLSPAESMNSLTVGSSFMDTNNANPISSMTTFCSDDFPAAYSSFGRGINKAIKPEILYAGGRNFVQENYLDQTKVTWRKSVTRPPGIKSAYPSVNKGSREIIGYSCGTSNSAALMSNNALECYNVLNNIFISETGDIVPYTYVAVLLKAMLVHGATWGDNKRVFIEALNLDGRQVKSDLHKFLGYGIPDVNKVKECTKNQVTLIGYGDIKQGQAYVYSIPLPFDFHDKPLKRKLTVTLAYFSPIHPSSVKYREKQLWFVLVNGDVVGMRTEYDYNVVQRGTLQHEIFETGTVNTTWNENNSLLIKINCRGDASDKDVDTNIPYALFATFEMAEEYGIDVYQKIVNKIRLRNPVLPNIT